MVSAVFKTVCGAVMQSWVGSIPTRLRQFIYKGFQPFPAGSLFALQRKICGIGDLFGDHVPVCVPVAKNI